MQCGLRKGGGRERQSAVRREPGTRNTIPRLLSNLPSICGSNQDLYGTGAHRQKEGAHLVILVPGRNIVLMVRCPTVWAVVDTRKRRHYFEFCTPSRAGAESGTALWQKVRFLGNPVKVLTFRCYADAPAPFASLSYRVSIHKFTLLLLT